MTDSVPAVSFPTVVFEARPGVTGLVVPPDELAGLGAGKRPAVVVTVHGIGDAPTEPYSYRNTVGSMGGRSLVSLSREHRAASGLVGGQQVEVTLVLDTEPRVVEVPAALAEAWAGDDALRASFAALSPSRQKALTLPIADARTDTTRERRVAAALDALRG
ncbi:DUF1905 domain-containing protein [Frigoribacterium sp. ACAM 257]|uniref:YdeI/OmpD-associated family protein n=1 Tax=Frigoribacterium sp. ACAM 257 TaxID=2508998 RepID=UPI0011B99F77|nr:YdeI/OmpD-associated family protein [Frigoribacterium sp. ACAM 257]TWX38828.1 DUF1905 domain-containing protein [Frigoribacterium sp. ACAM 257]